MYVFVFNFFSLFEPLKSPPNSLAGSLKAMVPLKGSFVSSAGRTRDFNANAADFKVVGKLFQGHFFTHSTSLYVRR